MGSNPLLKYRAATSEPAQEEPAPTGNPLAQYRPAESAPAQEETTPSFLDRVKKGITDRLKGGATALAQNGISPLGAMKAAGEVLGGEGGGEAVERGLVKGIPLAGAFAEEIEGGVEAAKAAVTGGNIKQAYETGRASGEAKTKKALTDHPALFLGSQIGTGIAAPGLGSTAIAKAGFGLGEATISAAADSDGNLTDGEVGKVIKDGATGLGLGIVAHGTTAAANYLVNGGKQAAKRLFDRKVAKITDDADLLPKKAPGLANETDVQFKPPAEPGGEQAALDAWAREVKAKMPTARTVPGKAELTYRHQVLEGIGEGATPTEKTRAWSNETAKNNALELVESHPKLKKAVNAKDQAAIRDAAEEIANEAGRKTDPVWSRLDKDVGMVPTAELKARIQAEIAAISEPARRNEEARLPALRKLMSDLDRWAMRYGGNELPHRKVRDLATSLLKEKNQVVGAIAETPNYTFRRENHAVIDGYLNDRLNTIAATKPDLAPKIDELRAANRKVASGLAIAGVADNALSRAERVKPTRAQEVVAAAKETAQDFNGGIAVGLSRKGIKAAGILPEDLGNYTEEQVRRFGELAYAIRKGKKVEIEKAAADLEASGVPQKVVRLFLAPVNASQAQE